MQARALWSVGVLVVATLSGCLAPAEPSGDASDEPSGTTQSFEPGQPGSTSTALLPTASFSVAWEGNATVPENGTISVPAGVILTFDASNSTGDSLMFAWTFGDNETADGIVVEHAFAAPGNYTVTLTVSDLHGANASASERIAAFLAAPPTPVFLRTDTITLSQSATVVLNQCVTQEKNWVFVDKETNGTLSVVNRIRATMSGSSGGASLNMALNLYVLDPAGKTIDQKTGGTSAKTIDKSGTYGPGTYKLKAEICASTGFVPQGTYTATGTAYYYTR